MSFGGVGARSRFSDYKGAITYGTGLPPVELWGVAQKDGPLRLVSGRAWKWSTVERGRAQHRSAAACARRRERRAAKAANVPLKAWLRSKAARS